MANADLQHWHSSHNLLRVRRSVQWRVAAARLSHGIGHGVRRDIPRRSCRYIGSSMLLHASLCWASLPNMTTFDTDNHRIIDRGNGSPSINLFYVMASLHKMSLAFNHTRSVSLCPQAFRTRMTPTGLTLGAATPVIGIGHSKRRFCCIKERNPALAWPPAKRQDKHL